MVKVPGYNDSSHRRMTFFAAMQIVGTILILSVNIFFLYFVLSKSQTSQSAPEPKPVEDVDVTVILNPISSMIIDPNENSSVLIEEALGVILYDNKMQEGKWVVIENANEECTNILDFNDKTSSVSFSTNTTCIRLYENTACLGDYIDLTSNSTCKHDLSLCPVPFDNETSSLSRCDFMRPQDPMSLSPDRIKTTRGEVCKTHCTTYGDSWYSCYTDDLMTKWDYCSPRPEVDYYGYECKDVCSLRNWKDYTWCHLKKGGWGYCSTA